MSCETLLSPYLLHAQSCNLVHSTSYVFYNMMAYLLNRSVKLKIDQKPSDCGNSLIKSTTISSKGVPFQYLSQLCLPSMPIYYTVWTPDTFYHITGHSFLALMHLNFRVTSSGIYCLLLCSTTWQSCCWHSSSNLLWCRTIQSMFFVSHITISIYSSSICF